MSGGAGAHHVAGAQSDAPNAEYGLSFISVQPRTSGPALSAFQFQIRNLPVPRAPESIVFAARRDCGAQFKAVYSRTCHDGSVAARL